MGSIFTSQGAETNNDGQELTRQEKKFPVIASIDFGTCFTGYTFKIRDNDDAKPSYANELEKKHELTCILFDADKKFDSYGRDALQKYIRLSPADRDNVYFYRNFKTSLTVEDKNLKLADTASRHAIDPLCVFKGALDYLKKCVIKRVNEVIANPGAGAPIIEGDVMWVITFPTAWNDSYRAFMRKSATDAGMNVNNIRLVTEPEAASMYIRDMCIKTKGNKDIKPLEQGAKYFLVDLGAGTVDLCVHEILEDGKLMELYPAAGAHFGGSNVNFQFEELLKELFGNDCMQKLKRNKMFKYFNLLQEFEDKKQNFDPSAKDVVLSVDFVVQEFEEHSTESMNERISSGKFHKKVKYEKDTGLVISGELMKDLFEKPLGNIISFIEEKHAECSANNLRVQMLLLTGGFSDSDYVRNNIKEAMKKRNVEVVHFQDAKCSVMFGALKMGSSPKSVIKRRSRYTYGFYKKIPFDEKIHPQELKCDHEGITQCDRVFHKLIEKGEVISHGQLFSRESKTVYKKEKHNKRLTSLWKSDKTDPKYCTKEEQCSVVATIEIPPPRGGWPSLLHHEQQLIVLENEFQLKFVNKITEQEHVMLVHYEY
ncbi:heat shock 70 kDa protein 12A-like [Mya arenaria]|uniref:heat shock 70 kDa protein 12A-like n=1 Tax=Mya arenaria TaxID=6604 RepID=UPI0022E478A1|nr:heat shock 70 kDa protein 12A-like [Mya arenaria]